MYTIWKHNRKIDTSNKKKEQQQQPATTISRTHVAWVCVLLLFYDSFFFGDFNNPYSNAHRLFFLLICLWLVSYHVTVQATHIELQLYLASVRASPRVVIRERQSQSITHFLEHLKQTETTHISMGTGTCFHYTSFICFTTTANNKLRVETYRPGGVFSAAAGLRCRAPGAPPPLHPDGCSVVHPDGGKQREKLSCTQATLLTFPRLPLIASCWSCW